MASLMEELISTLELEEAEYAKLLKLSQEKTQIIVQSDIAALQKLTDEEQIVVDNISHLDHKRETTLKDIANVINKDVESLKLRTLIELLSSQPKEAARLAAIHDKLMTTVGSVKKINEHNQDLIAHSLEMVGFELNMIQSMRRAPETANYNRGGINAGGMLGSSARGFDAKQ